MDKAALVGVDIDRGRELIAALDRDNLKIAVALWVFLPEYEDWRLVLASRRFHTPDPRAAYGLLYDAAAKAGFTEANTPPVMILRMDEPFVKDLRRMFAKTASVEGMRLGGQMFGARFLEDGYVYRIS